MPWQTRYEKKKFGFWKRPLHDSDTFLENFIHKFEDIVFAYMHENFSDSELEHVFEYKDLGIIFITKLNIVFCIVFCVIILVTDKRQLLGYNRCFGKHNKRLIQNYIKYIFQIIVFTFIEFH